jgi:hypothetical protein
MATHDPMEQRVTSIANGWIGANQRRKAQWLWSKSPPAEGSIVEKYLRSRGIDFERAISGPEPIPGTIRYLEPQKRDHHPAMIAAFGLADEPEPGSLHINEDAVMGVHLTLLRPDGSGKARIERNKIMVGPSAGFPIMLAPMNDLLGLAITEGVEDALSIRLATGLGAWAAGSASRMPALADAVPDCTDFITICADADDDGRRYAHQLAKSLHDRGMSVNISEPNNEAIAA